LCLITSVVCSMKPNLLAAQSHREMHKDDKLATLSKVLIIISLAFFAAATVSSDIPKLIYNMACKKQLCISVDDLTKARSHVFWMTVRMVANFLGKSLISAVFFADGVVTLMYFFHHHEMMDSLEVQCARARLVEDLGTIFPKTASVSQDEEVRQDGTAVVSMGALASVQAMLSRIAEVDAADVGRAAAEIAAVLGSAAVPVRDGGRFVLERAGDAVQNVQERLGEIVTSTSSPPAEPAQDE